MKGGVPELPRRVGGKYPFAGPRERRRNHQRPHQVRAQFSQRSGRRSCRHRIRRPRQGPGPALRSTRSRCVPAPPPSRHLPVRRYVSPNVQIYAGRGQSQPQKPPAAGRALGSRSGHRASRAGARREGLTRRGGTWPLMAFLNNPLSRRVRTNNHGERTNRMFRFLEKVRYKWRRRRTPVRFVVLTLAEVWSEWEPPKANATRHPKSGRRGRTQPQARQGSRRVA